MRRTRHGRRVRPAHRARVRQVGRLHGHRMSRTRRALRDPRLRHGRALRDWLLSAVRMRRSPAPPRERKTHRPDLRHRSVNNGRCQLLQVSLF
jgi:hypothetical protein